MTIALAVAPRQSLSFTPVLYQYRPQQPWLVFVLVGDVSFSVFGVISRRHFAG